MLAFLTLLFKISPLYLLITVGYFAGKYSRLNKEIIAQLLMYVVAPIVIFNSVLATTLTLNVLALPLLFFVVCCLICLATFLIAKRIWTDPTKNILAFTAGNGNVGYFGLPVAVALFGPEVVGPIAVSILGFVLYENTLGFFITAKGHHTVGESLLRIIKLPTLYTFILALILNVLGAKLSPEYIIFADVMRNIYASLGMILIGLGLAGVTQQWFDGKFVLTAFLAKFVIWPLVMFGIIAIDTAVFYFFSADIHRVMVLISVVPLAANTVTYATALRAHPEKASLAVLLSTVFALLYIPLIAAMLHP